MPGTRFAHFTDLHLPLPSPPKAGDLLGKRLLGYLSWRRKRKFQHELQALEALVEDRQHLDCTTSVITGDIVNISLPSEFAAARNWLKNTFDSADSLYAPGNHDAYARVRWEDGLGQLSAWMAGVRFDDPSRHPPADANDFPYVRVVDEVSFIVLNSARPTAPGLATGRLGREQLSRLRQELARARKDGLCRVLALHHPVADGVVSRRKALDDAPALRAVLAETGVELVLHGHAHRPSWSVVDTDGGPRPVVGGGSASLTRCDGAYRPARYNLFSVRRGDYGCWRVNVIVRELDLSDRSVSTIEQRSLL